MVSLICRTWRRVFGRRYYANIVGIRGTASCEVTSRIFRTRGEAEAHRRVIEEDTLTFVFLETVSFRSRKVY